MIQNTVSALKYKTYNTLLFLVMDKRSIATTIVRGQNMQICYSLRCKQIDMSMADQ